jgi:hypothetical protein
MAPTAPMRRRRLVPPKTPRRTLETRRCLVTCLPISSTRFDLPDWLSIGYSPLCVRQGSAGYSGCGRARR